MIKKRCTYPVSSFIYGFGIDMFHHERLRHDCHYVVLYTVPRKKRYPARPRYKQKMYPAPLGPYNHKMLTRFSSGYKKFKNKKNEPKKKIWDFP
jgi:hypothetical protein